MTDAVVPPAQAIAPPLPPAPTGATPRTPAIDPATRRPTLVVAAIIGVLFFGSSLLNEALPGGTTEVPAGGEVKIGETATMTAVAGWEVSPHESGGGVRLEKGVVALDLFPETVTTDARGLADAYLEQILEPDSTELTTTEVEPADEGDTTGVRFRYQGLFTGAEGPIEGEVTTFVIGGNGIVADAWTRQGALDSLLGEVREMVASIVIRP